MYQERNVSGDLDYLREDSLKSLLLFALAGAYIWLCWLLQMNALVRNASAFLRPSTAADGDRAQL